MLTKNNNETHCGTALVKMFMIFCVLFNNTTKMLLEKENLLAK
jgi:hypothetical protein